MCNRSWGSKIGATLLLLSLTAFNAIATDVIFNMTDVFGIQGQYATNRPVKMNSLSPFSGNYFWATSDVSGNFYVSNALVTTYAGVVQAPPNSISFSFWVSATNLGTIPATGITSIPANTVSTYPAGQTAYSVQASDNRYAPKGSSPFSALTAAQSTNLVQNATNNQTSIVYSNAALFAGTNLVLITSNGLASAIGSQGVTALTATNIATNQVFLGTNGMNLASGIAAFRQTNTFDVSGAGVAAATAATNALGVASGLAAFRSTNAFDVAGAATTVSNALVGISTIIYVSTSGNDATGSGTIANPLATITNAIARLNNNGRVILRGGDYDLTSAAFGNLNVSNCNISIEGYPGERVKFWSVASIPASSFSSLSNGIYTANAASFPTFTNYLVANTNAFETGHEAPFHPQGFLLYQSNAPSGLQSNEFTYMPPKILSVFGDTNRCELTAIGHAASVPSMTGSNAWWSFDGTKLYVKFAVFNVPGTVMISSTNEFHTLIYGGNSASRMRLANLEIYGAYSANYFLGVSYWQMDHCLIAMPTAERDQVNLASVRDSEFVYINNGARFINDSATPSPSISVERCLVHDFTGDNGGLYFGGGLSDAPFGRANPVGSISAQVNDCFIYGGPNGQWGLISEGAHVDFDGCIIVVDSIPTSPIQLGDAQPMGRTSYLSGKNSTLINHTVGSGLRLNDPNNIVRLQNIVFDTGNPPIICIDSNQTVVLYNVTQANGVAASGTMFGGTPEVNNNLVNNNVGWGSDSGFIKAKQFVGLGAQGISSDTTVHANQGYSLYLYGSVIQQIIDQNGSYFFATNATPPAAALMNGGMCFWNSNATTIFLLKSSPGSTAWASTNFVYTSDLSVITNAYGTNLPTGLVVGHVLYYPTNDLAGASNALSAAIALKADTNSPTIFTPLVKGGTLDTVTNNNIYFTGGASPGTYIGGTSGGIVAAPFGGGGLFQVLGNIRGTNIQADGHFIGNGFGITNAGTTNIQGAGLTQVTNIVNALSPSVNSNALLFAGKMDSTNGFSTGQTASNLVTLGDIGFGPSGLSTNINGKSNFLAFVNSGSGIMTNGAFIWDTAVGQYTNWLTGAVVTNTGSSWVSKTNAVSLYSIAGSSPNGQYSQVSGASPAPLAVFSAAINDHMIMLGYWSVSNQLSISNNIVTNMVTIVSSNAIASTNGFGIGTVLTNPVVTWNSAIAVNSAVNGGAMNFQAMSAGQANTNTGSGGGAAILSGFTNRLSLSGASVIAGGALNSLGGGFNNFASIGGGLSNTIGSADGGVIAGGEMNNNQSYYSSILGGLGNSIPQNIGPAISLGGYFNTNSGVGSVILGGSTNKAIGRWSIAMGTHAWASNDYTFVWSGVDQVAMTTPTNSQHVVTATNGQYLNGPLWLNAMNTNGGIYILSNQFSLWAVTNSMPNFAHWWGPSNGNIIDIYYSNGVPFMKVLAP